MASCSGRGGSGWPLGNTSALKEQRCSGTAAQGGLESPSLEVSMNRGDVAAGDVAGGHGEVSGA